MVSVYLFLCTKFSIAILTGAEYRVICFFEVNHWCPIIVMKVIGKLSWDDLKLTINAKSAA